jgi:hypothetical protein
LLSGKKKVKKYIKITFFESLHRGGSLPEHLEEGDPFEHQIADTISPACGLNLLVGDGKSVHKPGYFFPIQDIPVFPIKPEQGIKIRPDPGPTRDTADPHPVLSLPDSKGCRDIALAGSGGIEERFHLKGI